MNEDYLKPNDEEPTVLREIELRYVGPRRKGERVTSSADLAPLLRQLIPDGPREYMVAIFMDAKNRPIGWHRFAGTLAATVIQPADVFRPALLCGAHLLALGHNHPSGEVLPSPEDVELTQRIGEAGKLMGVRLLDHVIIGDPGSYFSFVDAGLCHWRDA